MMDIQDRNYCPNLQEIDEYIKNPVFKQFCLEIKTKYKCNEKIEYSSCSYEKGWNIKFKKAGKTLCTIYPRKNYFTVMVVKKRNRHNFSCMNLVILFKKYITILKKEITKDGL